MNATYDLTDKVVLITGGTGGIGSATARELLARGARVAIVDRDPATPDIARRLFPAGVLGLIADVTDRAAMDGAAGRVVEQFGRLDIAIANAGVLAPGATLRTMPAHQVDLQLAVNINGVVNTVSSCLDEVIANQGQVVLISSVFAFLNGMGAIPYAMSKAAVEQLGRGLRVELAAHGASSTIAYFSLIQTEMIARGVDADPSVRRLMSTLPGPFLKRLPPTAAATAIAEGLVHRSARVMVPGRWKPFAALQGLINPGLDARLATDARTQAALTHLDQPTHAHAQTGATT